MARKIISICTPCYNEEDNIRTCHETIRRIFEEQLPDYDFEHIIADNCSTDRTPQILREMAAADRRLKVIFNRRNFGIVRNGYNAILNATGDAVLLFMPADLQDPPELLPEFVRKWEEGYDVVYGIRAEREEGWLMRTTRRLYYRVVASLSELDMPLNVGDYQLIDKSIAQAFHRFHDVYPYPRAMTFECSSKTIGIPYRWRKREHGVSKNRLRHLLDQGLNGIISVSNVPVRLALLGGFLMSALSILYALLMAVTTLISVPLGEISPPGIPTVIVGLFMLNGILLFFIGVLGEYIISLHSHVRVKPLIVERGRINFDHPGQGDSNG